MSQSLARIYVHFIFSTKSRFQFLQDCSLRGSVHAYLAEIFNSCHSPAIEVGGTDDHVHALCSLGRNFSAADLIRETKSNSSVWIRRKGGLLAKFEWQKGYGAFSVGLGDVGKVREYIRNQMEHHRVKSFQEEFIEILQAYEVPFDERYIWS